MIELSRRDARRLALTAQLLSRPRPTSFDQVVEGVRAVQVDLTNHVATSPDLVFWSRLGRRRRPGDLDAACADRRLIEVFGHLRPASDVALMRVEMATWPGAEPSEFRLGLVRWLEANARAHHQVIEQLRDRGPLSAKQLVDLDVDRSWRSSGWNNAKSAVMLLERLAERGEVAVSHREGRERVWDLADRVYPPPSAVTPSRARQLLGERRLASMGILRTHVPGNVDLPSPGAAGVEVSVAGVRGTWRALPELLGHTFVGRTALLSPFDQLVVDRRRLNDIFEFDFALEMFKPVETRIWGYYALPVLHGDRLVGSVDAQSDRREGVLRVHRIHHDRSWTPTIQRGVEAELTSLAHHLGLQLVLP